MLFTHFNAWILKFSTTKFTTLFLTLTWTVCNLSLIFWPPELEASLFTDGRLPPNLGDHHYLIKQLTVAYYCNVCLWGKLFEYTCCRKYDLFDTNQVKWCTPVEVVKVTNQLFLQMYKKGIWPQPRGRSFDFLQKYEKSSFFLYS